MKKFFTVFTVVLIFLFVAACSGGSKKKEEAEVNDESEVSDETVSDEDGTPAGEADECDFVDGLNEKFMVGDLERSFILRLPKEIDSGKKFPVVFFYHGYGDTAANFELLLKSYVDNEEMPFILVVPEARSDKFGFDGASFPTGLDWDMMNLSDGSAEADMFDAVLACIEKKWSVDEKHVHIAGFSAGAIAANSIAQLKSEKVASVLAYSSAYFSDPKSRDALGEIMGMKVGDFFSWPDFAEKHNKYPQVFVFGDKEKDSWGQPGMFTIYFNKMGRLGAGFLSEMGHEAILCEHDQEHTVAGISQEGIIKFFKDHPFGTEKSSYREEMPADFTKICHFFTEADLPEDEEEDNDSDQDEDEDGTDDSEQNDDSEQDDGTGQDQDQEQDTDDTDAALGCSFKEGLNEKLVVGEGQNKLERSFILRLPKGIDSDKKFPIVFFYHPYTSGDVDAVLAQTDEALASFVNNDEMPFILVLPKAQADKFNLGGQQPTGLGWDIMNLEDGNAEADMFDRVLKCLESKIDTTHIHLSGFSAGAIAADSIALMRSDKIASVITYSGAYMSNDNNLYALGKVNISGNEIPVGSFFNWPDFADEHNKYTQMLIFGAAEQDVWSIDVPKFSIDFNTMGNNDGAYLFDNGHGVIKCNHGGDHNPPSSAQEASNLIQFFKNHSFGQVSPYKENLPEGLQSNCIFIK